MSDEAESAGVDRATLGGDVPAVPDGGCAVDDRFEARLRMNAPDRPNERLRHVMERVDTDDDLYGLWVAANVNATERLGMTDHGPVHVKIAELFQLDRLLREKIRGGGLESMLEVEAPLADEEKPLLTDFAP